MIRVFPVMKNRIRHNKTPYRGTPKTNRFITLLNPGLFLEGFFCYTVASDLALIRGLVEMIQKAQARREIEVAFSISEPSRAQIL